MSEESPWAANLSPAELDPLLQKALNDIEKIFSSGPENLCLIGYILGHKVYLDTMLPDRPLIHIYPKGHEALSVAQALKLCFTLDDPFIKGTKVEVAARKLLEAKP